MSEQSSSGSSLLSSPRTACSPAPRPRVRLRCAGRGGAGLGKGGHALCPGQDPLAVEDSSPQGSSCRRRPLVAPHRCLTAAGPPGPRPARPPAASWPWCAARRARPGALQGWPAALAADGASAAGGRGLPWLLGTVPACLQARLRWCSEAVQAARAGRCLAERRRRPSRSPSRSRCSPSCSCCCWAPISPPERPGA